MTYHPLLSGKSSQPTLQPKLKIGAPGDRYEREADAVADHVMSMPEGESLRMQPLEEEEEMMQMQPIEEEEEMLQPKIQMKPSSFSTSATPVQFQQERGKSEHSAGMPGSLRAGLETLSGESLSGVRVHYNSPKPSRLDALAYTQGKDIHLGPGEERHLAHEGGHVVQQLQGRVQETARKKGVPVNDDAYLEREADAIGKKALQVTGGLHRQRQDHFQTHPTSHQIIQRRALLPAENTAAIAHARATYDEMSVRIIQNIAGLAGADIDGIFGPITARAVSDYQTTNGIAPDDGLVRQDSLDVMIANRVAAGRRNEAIHLVTDFYNLDITTDTLSVYSQPGATRVNPAPPPASFPADTDFESGGLRVIRVGTAAFANAVTLRDTIQRELNRAAPAVAGPAAPHGALLNNADARDAIRYTNRHYQDRRSIMALQGMFVGVNPTGVVDADLVQRIADEQNATGTLVVDGKVGRNTLEHLFIQLRDSDNHNAAMRLVMDFYDMPDYDNLLTIYYQDFGGYTGLAGTSRNPRGPVRVRVRRALYMPFAAMVHTLRHELEHVSHHREGILSADTREFLSEANEIISTGMEHETLFDVSTPDASGTGLMNVSGFQNDLDRMITRWELMPAADQRTYWGTFTRARAVIRARIARTYRPTRAADQAEWAAATPAQRAALTALLARVNAAVRP